MTEASADSNREAFIEERLAYFRSVAHARPVAVESWLNLGLALQRVGRPTEAIEAYHAGLRAIPNCVPLLQTLGCLLVSQGDMQGGLGCLRQALALEPATLTKLLIALAIPPVYASRSEMQEYRSRLLKGVRQIAGRKLKVDARAAPIPTSFYSVYQGGNDRKLHADLGRIYRGADLCEGRPVQRPGGKLRIGFLSAYLRDHTIGLLNIGRVERLPRDRFEVVVLSIGQHERPLAERFRRAADTYVPITGIVPEASRLIAEQQLDILFFTDVGMEPLSTTLAYSRMAPVQVATWGHPVTTGSRHMDGFLSSELLETERAQTHYTEQLLLPPSLATYYERPRIEQSLSRKDLGLSDSATLYACPQTHFKFHPDFDEPLAQILRQDSGGRLVLLQGSNPEWRRRLEKRFQQSMPDVADRIDWLPSLPKEHFQQLFALCDVSLDPLHFGGGNTTYEALATGVPVVTFAGEYLRSRITRSLYAKMAGGCDPASTPAPCATSPEDYARLACEVAAPGKARDQARDWTRENREKLFEDEYEVLDFANAIEAFAEHRSE